MSHSPRERQVLASTFHPAPLDLSLSVPELYEYHAEHSPNHPVFVYSDIGAESPTSISYSEAWKHIQSVARIVSAHVSRLPHQRGRTVIAVLAQSDTFSHIYLIVAIMTLGYAAFPMAPRNNAEITARLLKATGTACVFTESEGPVNDLAREAVGLLSAEGIEIPLLPMVVANDWSVDDHAIGHRIKAQKNNDNDTLLILHSSGTTAAPKPVQFSKKGLINAVNSFYFATDGDWSTKRIAGHANSTFHASGTASYTLSTGATFALYQPSKTVPTASNSLASAVADQCNIVFCVPVFLEAWAQDPESISVLKIMDAVLFSGAALSSDIGEQLVGCGVRLSALWGSTEILGLPTMLPLYNRHRAEEWDWFQFSPVFNVVMKEQPHLAGVSEPIILPSETYFPHSLNTTYMGEAGFTTGDLLERHKKNPQLWRVCGRVDDQIMLSTGDNVNPLPIEQMIVQHPQVAAAIVFGGGRPHVGLLVTPAPSLALRRGDEDEISGFKDLIWPIVEAANAKCPLYCYVTRGMIIVTSKNKPIEYTPKGTVKRARTVELYAPEIAMAYRAGSVALIDVEYPDRAS